MARWWRHLWRSVRTSVKCCQPENGFGPRRTCVYVLSCLREANTSAFQTWQFCIEFVKFEDFSYYLMRKEGHCGGSWLISFVFCCLILFFSVGCLYKYTSWNSYEMFWVSFILSHTLPHTLYPYCVATSRPVGFHGAVEIWYICEAVQTMVLTHRCVVASKSRRLQE